MSRLLLLSFDCQCSPNITLKPVEHTQPHEKEQLQGWGFAWYPSENYAAVIMKDEKTKSGTMAARVLSDWRRFQSCVFICHLRGAAKNSATQNTQPFSRSYAGRDWVFSHNGDLTGKYQQRIPLGNNPAFEPLGNTDSEYVFCWLMEQIHLQKARKIADVNWQQLNNTLKEINQFGTFNIVLSDGEDMMVYQDINGFNTLYWARKKPPIDQTVYETEHTYIDVNDDRSSHRTFIIMSTYPHLIDKCSAMTPGQMFIISRGLITWSNDNTYHSIKSYPKPITKPAAKTNIKNNKNFYLTDINYQQDDVSTGIILNYHHITTYTYSDIVQMSKHAFRLHPIEDRYQEILTYELSLSTEVEHEIFDDVFGNRVNYVEINKPYKQLEVAVRSKIHIRNIPITTSSEFNRRQDIPLVWMPWQRQMMMPYLLPPELPESQLGELIDFAMSFVKRNQYDVLNVVQDINNTIYRDFEYVSGSTTLETTAYDVYTHRRGVCQDFANLFICLARLLSIPARYRSGYIYARGENTMQAEATHAWVELYLPWLGWRGFDPTNGCLAGTDHIRVACGRNFFDATPTSGTIYKGGGQESLNVDVKVTVEK